MKVTLLAPQVLGNKKYPKGENEMPDHLVHNRAFKALVVVGVARIAPRDQSAQKIQMSRDVEAMQKAKAHRHAKAHQSAMAASSAIPSPSNAAGLDQALPTPASPISAGAAVVTSASAAPVTARKTRKRVSKKKES